MSIATIRNERFGLSPERAKLIDHLWDSLSSRNKSNACILGTPAVSGGRLFTRSDNRLFAIGK
jgi:hypothetical protein